MGESPEWGVHMRIRDVITQCREGQQTLAPYRALIVASAAAT
jgi:hypothetical protein